MGDLSAWAQISQSFTAIITWFVTAFQNVTAIFWVAETGLTFIGQLVIIPLGIGVVLLVIGILQGLLRFRS